MSIPETFNALRAFRGDEPLAPVWHLGLFVNDLPTDRAATLEDLVEPTFAGYERVEIYRWLFGSLSPTDYFWRVNGVPYEVQSDPGGAVIKGLFSTLTIGEEVSLWRLSRLPRARAIPGVGSTFYVHAACSYSKSLTPRLGE